MFENISFSIHKDQKIAFVAKNGTGKTSILNILTNLDQPDNGQVVLRKDIVISFLPQEPQLDNNLTEVKETKKCTQNELKMKQLGSVYYRGCIN